MHASQRRDAQLAKILIWLLLCSNVATALVASLSIDRLNERYAAEMSNAVPGLHELMLLAQESTNTHRAALNLQLASDSDGRREVRERLDEARSQERARLAQMFPDGEAAARAGPRAALWEAAQAYAAALGSYLELVGRGRLDEATGWRAEQLRPAFDLYQLRQREESIRLNFEAIKGGAEINALVTTRKGLLVGFGVWPLLVLGLMLVTVGVLGALVWHHVRRSGLGDEDSGRGEAPRF